MPVPRPSPDAEQMNQDIIDVYVNHSKRISDFPTAYQDKMVACYRFSGVRFTGSPSIIADRTSDTLDITGSSALTP